MKKLFLAAGVLATLVLGSCKKDHSSNDDNGSKTKLLKKVTQIENGVTTVYNFNYNGNTLTSFSSSDELESTAFTFDASGNITKVETRDHNNYSTYTYTYNNGVPVSGTFKEWLRVAGEPEDLIEDNVFTYTVVNNQVTKIKQDMKLDATTVTANLTYYGNGNLQKAQTEGDEAVTINFEYGSKKPGFPPLSKYVLDLGLSLQFTARNELLSAAYDFPGTDMDTTIVSQYTYDADGYPLTSTNGHTQLKFEYQ